MCLLGKLGYRIFIIFEQPVVDFSLHLVSISFMASASFGAFAAYFLYWNLCLYIDVNNYYTSNSLHRVLVSNAIACKLCLL